MYLTGSQKWVTEVRKRESVMDKTRVQKGEVRLVIKGRALHVNGTRTIVRVVRLL